MNNWERCAFWAHNPRYHHGLSKAERIEQLTGDWFIAFYGVPRHKRYNRMMCYGRPSGWGWSIKDKFDGPSTRSYRHSIRRNMRKRARREAKQELIKLQEELA